MLGQQVGIQLARGAFRILNETNKESKRGITESICAIGVSVNKEVDGGVILEVWTRDGKSKTQEYGLPHEIAKDIVDTSNRNKVSYTNHSSQMRRKLKAGWELTKNNNEYDIRRMKYEVGSVKEYQDSVSVLPAREEGHVILIERTAAEENQYCLNLVTIGEIKTIIKR